ncbi:MAG: glycoside hydrolase family 3 protein [Salana multivorans]|uniref:glycoside hydrolase family 3 protein n=1 Tax=Salana multivorans TaxID=120377 RepID=UPI000965DBB5|nr:glycoside hydrolase family 3 N-terminal domain-containing protein [Salana multivorans]MBN8881718.1 glycoside hydrolase family 3 protein [Salana multivorans]OJX97004.1 MAG: glycoside hydrolase family 3 [Micrococcales bacterium 73-15]
MTIARGSVRPVLAGAALVSALALVLAGCTSTPSTDPSDGASASASGTTAGDENTYSTREVNDGKTTFVEVTNPDGGKTLSYSPDSGIELLDVTHGDLTYAFKDMNRNGELDTWEDWRLDASERAADLAQQLSVEQIQGLMLFSSHERSPADGLTDAQKTYLSDDRLRNVLNAADNQIAPSVTWVNEMEAFVEGLASEDEPYVPVNFSSDPRSDAAGGYTASAVTDISVWPNSLGLAATFSPETVLQFGQMASEEYRALGINMALSPQIDLVTDPRWSRNNGTFGEDPELTGQLGAAYVEGFQSGESSVATTTKHFPGDGSGEGGRESHTDIGKFAVYPGGNEQGSFEPFKSTLDSGAVMLSYSIGIAADGSAAFGDKVATAYDKEKVGLLRDAGYDGVIMTDWRVTHDIEAFGGPWGMETATEEERHYAVIQSDVDMFGGNNVLAPVKAAYDLWQADFEAGNGVVDVDAETRFRASAERIVRMIMNNGAYENPYVDLEHSTEVIGSQDKIDAGYQAQLDSVVMLKNDGAIAAAEVGDWADKTVYVPQSYDLGFDNPMLGTEYSQGPTFAIEVAQEYFGTVVTDEVELDADGKVVGYTAPDLSDVDVTVVGIKPPQQGGLFGGFDAATGTYIPISLQYRPYTADGPNVRQTSIAGNVLADGTQENRSYLGQTSQISNEADLDAIERAAAAIEASGKDIPLITVIRTGEVMMDHSTVVPAEFEALSDAILIGYGVAQSAYFDVALGLHEPAARLPIGLPASMDAVEGSYEDVPKDVESYVDSAGNTYEFGFGLNYSGPIS